MANTGRPTTARRNPNTVRNNKGVYIEGNTARRLQEVPAKRSYSRQKPPVRKRVQAAETSGSTRSSRPSASSHQLSREAQRNREKAMNMSRGFVIFLALVSVAILFGCVHYLQLKSELTAKMKAVAAMESQLTELKEDNDAYESQVTSNVDLNAIKAIAIGRLGMRYPSDDQKMTYETSQSSYVRQYQDIPDSE
ncbi:hypothetical protein ACTNEW_15785 [Blautia sp. HCP3S3_G3]|uniref:hypothetical protein n=1 Tax=Blautia sp. HCP3S3_G3 TaxID=3438913 RepID=UPI003F8C33E1